MDSAADNPESSGIDGILKNKMEKVLLVFPPVLVKVILIALSSVCS